MWNPVPMLYSKYVYYRRTSCHDAGVGGLLRTRCQSAIPATTVQLQLAVTSHTTHHGHYNYFSFVGCGGYSSFLERPLLGIDLQDRYHPHAPRQFVDMNPWIPLQPGWHGGLINDAATVTHLGGSRTATSSTTTTTTTSMATMLMEYYQQSRGRANVELVPFSSVAPFQVAVTTQRVHSGDELFVSYGYNYWANRLRNQPQHDHDDYDDDDEQGEDDDEEAAGAFTKLLRQQEESAVQELLQVIAHVKERYAKEADDVAQLFNGLADLPILLLPVERGSSSLVAAARRQFLHPLQTGRRFLSSLLARRKKL